MRDDDQRTRIVRRALWPAPPWSPGPDGWSARPSRSAPAGRAVPGRAAACASSPGEGLSPVSSLSGSAFSWATDDSTRARCSAGSPVSRVIARRASSPVVFWAMLSVRTSAAARSSAPMIVDLPNPFGPVRPIWSRGPTLSSGMRTPTMPPARSRPSPSAETRHSPPSTCRCEHIPAQSGEPSGRGVRPSANASSSMGVVSPNLTTPGPIRISSARWLGAAVHPDVAVVSLGRDAQRCGLAFGGGDASVQLGVGP